MIFYLFLFITIKILTISFQFIDIGRVVSVENNHKPIDKATKGMEVCIKIDPIPGEAPKMFGRHFDETDLIYSKVRKCLEMFQKRVKFEY